MISQRDPRANSALRTGDGDGVDGVRTGNNLMRALPRCLSSVRHAQLSAMPHRQAIAAQQLADQRQAGSQADARGQSP
jgi:hypothetical protein